MNGWDGGLAGFAFWGFIAAISVAGVWDKIKKREVQHETLRRMIESGKTVDQAALNKLLDSTEARRPDRDLRTASIIVLSLAPGLAILGLFVSQLAPPALMPILGSAALLLCLGIGLLVASSQMRRSLKDDDSQGERPTRSL